MHVNQAVSYINQAVLHANQPVLHVMHSFMPLHPILLTQLIQQGKTAAALQLVRARLTPLADARPELLPALKRCMTALLPAGPLLGDTTTCVQQQQLHGEEDAAAGEAAALLELLLPQLQTRLGLEPPRLVQLLRALMGCHRCWFRLQRCTDPLAGALGLQGLLLLPECHSASNCSRGGGSGGGGGGAGTGRGSGTAADHQQSLRGPAAAAVAAAAPSTWLAAQPAAITRESEDDDGSGGAAAVDEAAVLQARVIDNNDNNTCMLCSL